MNKISKIAMTLLLGASTVVAEKSLSEDELKKVADMKSSFLESATPAGSVDNGKKCAEEVDCKKFDGNAKAGALAMTCADNACYGKITSCGAAKVCKIKDGEQCKGGKDPADKFNVCNKCAKVPTGKATAAAETAKCADVDPASNP